MPVHTPRIVRLFALGALIGPIIGGCAFFALGALRPGYSPVSEPISALGIGAGGAIMNAALVIDGALCLAALAVIWTVLKGMHPAARLACAILLGASPFGILWVGVFPFNEIALHLLGFQMAFGTPVVSFAAAGIMLRSSHAPADWRRFGTMLIIGAVAAGALLVILTTSAPPPDVALATGGGSYGLWERLLATDVQGLFGTMGVIAYRSFREK